MKIILLLPLLFTLISCAHTNEPPANELPKLEGPLVRPFPYEYDRVWRAVQKSLSKYPIRVNNIETGKIETEVLRGEKVWHAAHEKPKVQPGLRYQIVVQLVRGQALNGKASTEVSVEKQLSIEKNFFQGESPLQSNGLEEESILYRIDRELMIERALDHAYERSSGNK